MLLPEQAAESRTHQVQGDTRYKVVQGEYIVCIMLHHHI